MKKDSNISKKLATNLPLIILPVLLLSLGSSMSSLTRVYVSSGVFIVSIFLGALTTANFYTFNFKNKLARYILLFIFGIVVPALYIHSAGKVYGSGFQEYHEIWSPILVLTSMIGYIQILLYIGIFFILFTQFIRSLYKKIAKLRPHRKES